MKKRLTLALVASLVPSLALAHGNHPMAGCGLGYLLISHEDNERITQIIGVTTNHIGSQTFAISSGTSGCTEDGAVKLVREAEVFAAVNLESLRRDMAAGQGEFVDTFASLINSNAATRPQLVQFFHQHYSELFPSASTESDEMLSSLTRTLTSHPELLG